MNERDITEQEKAEKLAILYSIVNGTYQAPADKILDIATPHTKYPFFS